MTPFDFLTELMSPLVTRRVGGGAAISDSDLCVIRDAAYEWITWRLTIESVLRDCRESGAYIASCWNDDSASRKTMAFEAVIEVVIQASSAISEEYRETIAPLSLENPTREHLARALVFDQPDWRPLADQLGVQVPENYCVLTLGLSKTGSAHAETRIHGAIAATFGPRHNILTLLEALTLTVFIPHSVDESRLNHLVDGLGSAFGAPLLGAAVPSAHTELLDAKSFASELVALAIDLGRPPKVYRTRDLVLEYQLSRPGYGKQSLDGLLHPLRSQPMLMQTAATFVNSQLNRKVASRKLFVHTNTLDARLKKISKLVGFDIATDAGKRKLEAAVLIDHLDHNT